MGPTIKVQYGKWYEENILVLGGKKSHHEEEVNQVFLEKGNRPV